MTGEWHANVERVVCERAVNPYLFEGTDKEVWSCSLEKPPEGGRVPRVHHAVDDVVFRGLDVQLPPMAGTLVVAAGVGRVVRGTLTCVFDEGRTRRLDCQRGRSRDDDAGLRGP